MIFDDVLKSLEAKRSHILLTQRKDHLDYFQQKVEPFVKNRKRCIKAPCK